MEADRLRPPQGLLHLHTQMQELHSTGRESFPIEDLLDKRSRSPLARRLEARSPKGFIDELYRQLLGQGMLAPHAYDTLRHLINSPIISCTRGNGSRVLQAGYYSSGDDIYFAYLTIEILREKPPRVDRQSAEAHILPPGIAGLTEAMVFVEQWWHEYEMRQPAGHIPGTLKNIALFGDPTRTGLAEVPRDWDRILRNMARTLGIVPEFAKTRAEAELLVRNHRDRVDAAVLLTKSSDFDPALSELTALDSEPIILRPSDGSHTFSSVEAEIRRGLISASLEAYASNKASARELEPGESVYHRKVGNCPKYDLFDEGSPNPCKHGEGAYISWSGDKCVKGMARRYSNFDSSMLMHCKHKSKCGVYAVRRKQA